MTNSASDFLYSWRALRKSPGFTLACLFSLALGIGAATSVFSIVNTVLLRPYPFPDPGQLVIWRETMQEVSDRYPLLPDNYKHYLKLRADSKTVADAAIFQDTPFAVAPGPDHPQIVNGLSVSPNFFSVLGITPALGRNFLPVEAQEGQNNAVIISWSIWQRFFRTDPSVLGRSLEVGGEKRTVIAVLPKTFTFPTLTEMPGSADSREKSAYEIFQPLVPQDEELTSDDSDFSFLVVARLKPGISAKEASSELDGMEKAYSLSNHLQEHLGVVVEPLAQEVAGSISKPLWLLLGAVMGVLLITCVNLAGLQLARSVGRERDNSLRAALGAGRIRLFQATLAESLILSVIGGFAGTLFAFAGVHTFVAIAPANLPRINEVHVSWPILMFAAGLSVCTALLFGSLSAFRSLRTDPQRVLQSASAHIFNVREATATRRLLVVFEVALALLLLIFTSLVARSFSRLLSQDREFDSNHVILAKVDLSNPRYAGDTGAAARAAFVDRALDRLRANMNVQFAAATSTMPLTGETNVYGIHREDHPLPENEAPTANLRNISPQYFAAMRIPLVAGQEFEEKEREHPDHAIISEKAARVAWPGENPLGRTFRINGRTYTVTGIAADARIADLKVDAPVVYLPYWHDPPSSVLFIIRSPQRLDGIASTIRRELWHIDPQVAIPVIKSLDSQIDESVAAERFQTIVLSFFGVAALILAVLGVYGVISYSVSLREREFGVRVAFGSTRHALIRLIVRDASFPVVAGLILGIVASIGATRLIRSLLYDTAPTDPVAVAASAGLLLLAALLAALFPAYRASRVDPMRALRQE